MKILKGPGRTPATGPTRAHKTPEPSKPPKDPRDLCIQEVFEAQARKTPDAPALTFEGRRLSYRQVDIQASRFALRLRALGVRPGIFVALYAPRSLETILALLAILKAGGTYVALDMESPRERLALMLTDAEPHLILTLRPLTDKLPPSGAKMLFISEQFDLRNNTAVDPVPEIEDRPIAATDLAYVAFTSGSAGTPKGVCITHRSVVGLARANDYVSIQPKDIFLQFAPISFDASTFEIWCCLLNGAKLTLFPPRKPSLSELGEFIEREMISVLWLTAGLFHQMVDGQLSRMKQVRHLLTGGDVVSVSHARKALGLWDCRLVNAYGPTENTTFSFFYPIVRLHPAAPSVPIGRPLAGTEFHVLDEALQPVTAGEPGELFLGGDGLATGYLRNPALTAEKFIPHPFDGQPRARLYRTGDRVRLLPDGNMEFIGRMDRQVKILGYRVEPAEVEAVLREHAAVRDATVTVQRTIAGDERLVGAVAIKNGLSTTPAELRTFALRRLPPHMAPSEFVFLDEMPLNANGKIDRQAFAGNDASQDSPAMVSQSSAPKAENAISSTANTSTILHAIWRTVLGRQGISTGDQFFDVGGNSLRAAHLLALIQVQFRKRISMEEFSEHCTISTLATYLDGINASQGTPGYQMKKGGASPALFCMPGHGGLMTVYNAIAPHYSRNRPLYGLQSPGLLGQEEGTTIGEIAAAHVKMIRALQPSGPWHLLGYCFGGLVAFEAARQLQAEGGTVGVVAALHLNLYEMHFAPYRFRGIRPFFHFALNAAQLPGEFLSISRHEKIQALHRIYHRLRGGGTPGEDSIPSNPVERRVWEAHHNAWQHYVPEAFPGVVTLLRPRRTPLMQPDPKLGWGEVTGQQLEVRIVPGSGIHGQSLAGPNAKETAKIVEDAIEQWEKRGA